MNSAGKKHPSIVSFHPMLAPGFHCGTLSWIKVRVTEFLLTSHSSSSTLHTCTSLLHPDQEGKGGKGGSD